uniref:Putative DNA polymerase n=1 Tax=viral metagenome TaxID=1070528 RepID=A0A6M3K280_9ZZZZ
MKLTIISQYHPAAALHNPRLWATLLDDWENLPESVPHDFKIVDKPTIGTSGLYALDTETDGKGGLGQWSIAFRNLSNELCVMPFYGSHPDYILPSTPIYHNAKYDIRELRTNGMTPPEHCHDTMIMAYCMGLGKQAPKDDSKTKSGADMVGGLGLKYLARRHLGMTMNSWKDMQDHPELIPEYNATDSVATYLLAEKWLPVLPKHYFDIDMPLLPVLMKMEDRGIHIDQSFIGIYAKELDNRLAELDDIIPLNVHATQEVQSYVYGTLDIEPWKFTDSGAPSVDVDTLEKIDDPIVKSILEYKELYKDKGTYIDNYVKMRDTNNRVHCEFKQTSTSTGRLSAARPNIQNVDKIGNMRKLFNAPEGQKIVRLDWHLIEFGMLAVLAKDSQLINAFLTSDVHQETANALGIDRDTGKHINFLMQNGGSPWGMSLTYGIPISLSREYFNKYFIRFPAIKKFQDETVAQAYATNHVVGFLGRKRRIDALIATDWRIRKAGENEAKTMPMQNGAAEIVKLAMIDLHYKHNAPMVAQIHDELLFYINNKEAEDYAQWLREYVPTITEIDGVQFPVDVKIGNNWYECSQ